jgi:hypothetical protein
MACTFRNRSRILGGYKMRITYQNGKLFINLRKDEAENVSQNIGTPTEIDIGNIVVLHEDIANIVKERLKENDQWWDKIPHGPSMGE